MKHVCNLTRGGDSHVTSEDVAFYIYYYTLFFLITLINSAIIIAFLKYKKLRYIIYKFIICVCEDYAKLPVQLNKTRPSYFNLGVQVTTLQQHQLLVILYTAQPIYYTMCLEFQKFNKPKVNIYIFTDFSCQSGCFIAVPLNNQETWILQKSVGPSIN